MRCRRCAGEGCERCDYSGESYRMSDGAKRTDAGMTSAVVLAFLLVVLLLAVR